MTQFGPAKEVNRLGHVTDFERKMAARGDTWDNDMPWSSWSSADWKGCGHSRRSAFRVAPPPPPPGPPHSPLAQLVLPRGPTTPRPNLSPPALTRGCASVTCYRWKKSHDPMVKGLKPSKKTHTKNWLEWFLDFVKVRAAQQQSACRRSAARRATWKPSPRPRTMRGAENATEPPEIWRVVPHRSGWG